MAKYIDIKDTRYTISQVRAMRKDELITHVMGLSAEVNRLNRELEAVTNAYQSTKATKATKSAKAKPAKAKPAKATNWKNVSADDIHANFKLAGVTQTMQRRATFALNRGDTPTAVANYAVGTRRNTRWTKIMNGATKAQA